MVFLRTVCQVNMDLESAYTSSHEREMDPWDNSKKLFAVSSNIFPLQGRVMEALAALSHRRFLFILP